MRYKFKKEFWKCEGVSGHENQQGVWEKSQGWWSPKRKYIWNTIRKSLLGEVIRKLKIKKINI